MNRNRASFLAVLLFLAMSGCIDLPGIDPADPETPDAGTPESDGGLPDAGPPDLSVRLLTPVDTTYTNGTVDVSVEVKNGTPDAVELFVGDERLATLSSPYTFRWDTTSKPEGTYTLTAKARRGARTFASEARAVVVDRTPPQVVARSPAPGAQSVSVREPVRVTFSEPLDPTTLTDTAVRLSMRVDSVTTDLPKTLLLSSNDTVLTINPNARPDAPSELSIEVGSVKDRSGNVLVSSDAWSWRLPLYLGLGPALNADAASPLVLGNTMAVDQQGRPIVAWRESVDDAATSAYVRRWTGSSWEALGEAVHANPGGTPVYGLDVQVDPTGSPIIALSEMNTNGQGDVDLYVQRWTGQSWQPLGSAVRSRSWSNQTAPSLAVDSSGNIFVAALEYAEGNTNAHVHRWTGTTWELLGGLLSANMGNTPVSSVALQVDAAGRPVIAWSEPDATAENIYIQRWTGSVWESLGALSALPGNTPASGVSLQLDVEGAPVVAWLESDGSADSVYVWRSTGSDWAPVGGPLRANAGSTSASRLSLDLDTAGAPVVSWIEPDEVAENVYVRRWNGESWSAIGPALSANPNATPAYSQSLEVDPSGRLFISWVEYGPLPSSYNLYVRQLNN